MAWLWRYLDADGSAFVDDDGQPAGGAAQFPNQADAESWLGEHWRELAESGVDSVVLLEGDREVYGPMALNPPE